jgi:hypothetical protein
MKMLMSKKKIPGGIKSPERITLQPECEGLKVNILYKPFTAAL